MLGGLLVDASWRWVFVMNLPVGVLAWVLGRRALVRDRGRPDEPLPDLPGSVLLVVAVEALTGALVQALSWGWTNLPTLGVSVVAVAGVRGVRAALPSPPGSAAGAAVAADASVRGELRGRVPVQHLLRDHAAVQLPVVPGRLALQCPAHRPRHGARAGDGADRDGPQRRLVHRLGPGPIAALGSVLLAGSQLWRVFEAGPEPNYVYDLLPSILLSGAGVGLALGTLIAAGVTAFPQERSATGSAILNSSRQVASAVGVAVLVTLLGTAVGAVHGYLVAWAVGAAVALCAAGISLAVARPVISGAPGLEPPAAPAARGRRPAPTTGRPC